jgi:hypothetical protein
MKSIEQQRRALISKMRYLREQLEDLKQSGYGQSPAYTTISGSSHVHLERFVGELPMVRVNKYYSLQ